MAVSALTIVFMRSIIELVLKRIPKCVLLINRSDYKYGIKAKKETELYKAGNHSCGKPPVS